MTLGSHAAGRRNAFGWLAALVSVAIFLAAGTHVHELSRPDDLRMLQDGSEGKSTEGECLKCHLRDGSAERGIRPRAAIVDLDSRPLDRPASLAIASGISVLPGSPRGPPLG